MKKILTLTILQRGDEVLLGMKKKGFGEGKWNGFGGKVEEGETIEEGAIREVVEEACVTPRHLTQRGTIEFHTEDQEEILEVHIFYTNTFTGTPQETEEMRPAWFKVTAIPYKDMWPDDAYWLPVLLEGKNFTGSFVFDARGGILEHTLTCTQ